MITEFLQPKLEDNGVELDDMCFQKHSPTSHTADATVGILLQTFPGMVVSLRSDINWPPDRAIFLARLILVGFPEVAGLCH